jgi:hypothetical protein
MTTIEEIPPRLKREGMVAALDWGYYIAWFWTQIAAAAALNLAFIIDDWEVGNLRLEEWEPELRRLFGLT